MIASNLAISRISEIDAVLPYSSSLLGFAEKHDGTLHRIHNLSYSLNISINDSILEEYSYLRYSTINELLRAIVYVGRECQVLKRDIADAFRNIPIAPHQRWLMGFSIDRCHFVENCLSFSLCTTPFSFNLFAEAFH